MTAVNFVSVIRSVIKTKKRFGNHIPKRFFMVR